MSFESFHGPESFGPEKHKKEAKPDTLEVPEEMQKITEQIRDWWFGSRSKEAEKKQDETKETEKEEETKEAKEKKEVAEKIVTKRGGLFQRVTERIMEEREKSAEEIENMPEGQRKAYELMKKIMEKTKNYNNYRLNFCMAYDGRAEIVDAVNKILKSKVNKIEEKDFSKNLYLDSEPDLIIRTSGEKRISGFLPWQSSYSEFYFTEKHWPEFSKQDLIKAIEDFESRERRFGK